MAQYRLRAPNVEAMQLPAAGQDHTTHWNDWIAAHGFVADYVIGGFIYTDPATQQRWVATPGYWVVKGGNVFIIMTPEQFAVSYEPA